ncbi:MAG TPA: hypothetical protein VN577_10195 [Terriglobales bacterium]|nr:hypothetical protein [Terriglobales bacterium]
MKKRKAIEKPADRKLKAMSPTQVEKAQKAIDWLYEHGDAKFYSEQWYAQQKAHILECSKLWGQQ